MKQPKRYLITSALPYANGLKHIGHLAGAYLPADTYVRYLRAQKRDVVYVCGSDEHGAAITIQAMKEKTTPKEIVDKYHEILKSNMGDLGISFDIYHRTSSPIHHETAKEFFTALNDKGELEIKETEQFYDEEAKTFLADRYIVGTCPVCANENAYGDQCERCGTSLSPEQLINPRSTLSGNPPIKKQTKHWYLPLNKHEEFLKNWVLAEHREDWKTNVLGQCKSWLDAGLQPRAVTRDLDWGIKVPLTDAQGKVLYVWFDAPIGYISATKQWALDNNKDWQPYWNDKDTKLVHFIGKDNIVFHCIIFPVMLKLHGNILPDNVPANEFMNLEGDKMSTSRGWSIEMQDYIDDFVKKENGGDMLIDSLRYYLTTIAPENKDSEFTWKGFQDAVNSELVAIFGNFINRTWVLMHKLCKGKVPVLHADVFDNADKELFAAIESSKSKIENLLEEYRFRDALFEVIDLARKGNKYMQDKQPWIVAKQTNDDRQPTTEAQKSIDNCLHVCLQLTANLAIFINPFLPFTAKKMLNMMKVVDKMLEWENAGKSKLLSVGYSLREPQLLFRKIEDAEVAAQIEKLKERSKKMETNKPSTNNLTATVATLKPTIQFDDFAKIDLRTGIILSAEKVAKADKLLKLEVDLGFEKRTIVSGIALHYQPEDIIGKQVVIVANLAPRKMKGIESNGMILMAEDKDGKLHFVSPENQIDGGSGVS
ncbi:methionine--tRNA ligase [Ferruginibacter albus]|nr:methionine--tRNA ligase [Ferruginibacter albus]